MKANKVTNGMRVKIAGFSINGYTGNATIINSTVNDYGLVKVILEVSKGFPAQQNPAYYKPEVLTLRK